MNNFKHFLPNVDTVLWHNMCLEDDVLLFSCRVAFENKQGSHSRKSEVQIQKILADPEIAFGTKPDSEYGSAVAANPSLETACDNHNHHSCPPGAPWMRRLRQLKPIPALDMDCETHRTGMEECNDSSLDVLPTWRNRMV